MRKGLLISALTAVAIIGASLVATPASACHHRHYGAGYGYYGDGYGYRHLAYYGGGYGYRGYGWYGRPHLALWMSEKCQKRTLGNGLASRYGACPDRSNLWGSTV